MAYPSTVRRDQLVGYLRRQIGKQTEELLEWSPEQNGSWIYDGIIEDVMVQFREEDPELIQGGDNVERLMMHLRLQLWERIADHTVGFHNMSAPDGVNAQLAEVHRQAILRVKRYAPSVGDGEMLRRRYLP